MRYYYESHASSSCSIGLNDLSIAAAVHSVRLFGGASIRGEEGAPGGGATQARRLALVALLTTARPGAVTRDKLIAYLWPESGSEQGRHLLSESLHILRKALGADVFVAEGDTLRINADAVWSDVAEFEAALERGDLEAAVSLYLGPFLDGFFVREAPEFERWVESERGRLADRYATALESLAEAAVADSDYKAAVGWWKRLADHDPYNSRFALRLMQSMAAAGDPANAVKQAQEHSALLERELGVNPPDDLQSFIRRLRRGKVWRDSRLRSGADTTPAVVEAQTESAPRPEKRELERPPEGRRPSTLRTAVLVVVSAVIVGGVLIVLWLVLPRQDQAKAPSGTLVAEGVLKEREQIVLADFENRTSMLDLGNVITEALRIDLSQSAYVRVAGPGSVVRVLRRMEVDPGQPLDLALAREIAVREGLTAVIGGEVATVGGSYLISAAIFSAESGEVLAGFRESAADSTAILAAIDRLSQALRQRVGESVRAIRHGAPLEQVTTGSLEALRKYSQAIRVWTYAADPVTAIALFEEAIALDTGFAAAYLNLAKILADRGERARSRDAQTAAYLRRGRLTDYERYDVIASYHSSLGDYDKAITAYERLLDLYPADLAALNNLANVYFRTRDFARAERFYLKAVVADSAAYIPYRNAIAAQVAQGNFDEARETLDRYLKNVADTDVITLPSWLASARGDYETARQLSLSQDVRTPAERVWQARRLALLAQVEGRLADAEGHWQAVMAGLDGQYFLWAAARSAFVDVWLRGRPGAGLRAIESALERCPLDSLAPLDRQYLQYNPQNPLEDGLVGFFALAGQADRARQLLAEYEIVIEPELRERHQPSLHAARGALALAEGRPQEAITELKAWDNGTHCTICALPYLARAYEMAGALDSAITVYERYVRTPWLYRVSTDANHLAFALERLGQHYNQKGDAEQAIHYFGKFVDLWKEADPELQPRVEAARRTIASLSADR